MTLSLSTPTSGRAQIELPVGELVETQDRVRITLALDARTRGQARALVDKLAGDGAEYFSIPTNIDDDGDKLVLDYALDAAESLPFAVALPRWQASLATYIPELVAMARYLDICVRALTQLELSAVIAPAYLRYTPTSRAHAFGAFRLIAVPFVDVTLADWARSSADAWSWAPGNLLLGRPAPNAGPFAIGAALYTALVGDLYPALSTTARFRRALRGQIGRPVALELILRAALPASFGAEAAALAALVTGLLAPEPPRDWREQLQQLGERLGAYRTAVRWEYEGRIEIARAILERLAATATKDHVPWEVLARLRDRDHDQAGALAAVIDALDAGNSDAVRELVVQIRKIAHAGDGVAAGVDAGAASLRQEMIARAVAAIDKLGGTLADHARLHLAHVEARYLGRADEARARLAARAKTPWDDVLRCTMLARLHAGASEWPNVAKLCKDTRLATQAIEASGGQLGAYVIAYLDFLDGVAHFGAVGQYNDPLYLADAFTRFVASLDGARPVCAPDDPLIAANIHWLAWIGTMAQQLQIPTAATIRIGIEAYLGAHGLTSALSEQSKRQVPPLVWYDEDRLLALSRGT